MVKIDKKAIGEMKTQAEEAAKREIELARTKGDELTESDEEVIRNKFLFRATQILHSVAQLGPEKLLRSGYGVIVGTGWRDGYTRSPSWKKKAENRKRQKAAKLSRKANRNK